MLPGEKRDGRQVVVEETLDFMEKGDASGPALLHLGRLGQFVQPGVGVVEQALIEPRAEKKRGRTMFSGSGKSRLQWRSNKYGSFDGLISSQLRYSLSRRLIPKPASCSFRTS